MDEKITYEDVKEYENLFMLAPSFLLERFARKNTNLVSKFKSQIQSHLNNLDDVQRAKLNVILNSDVDELQAVMEEAYKKSGVKQYRVLANPKYKGFIENNLNELKKII
ncbi:MAG: hypothetical protein ILA26_09585 [Methanobrevibacter sp.]|uniref:hypothetical protein n=1 Tax=Methanobrevibacter sp. TaxID=66852 RepID=UPI001B787BCF|nr:hypothetical protein [Methanobrevibacter sp.]MBP3792263.1 hypothetical protein [Methanobrevibacter sp.]